jgi:hypothetical protein
MGEPWPAPRPESSSPQRARAYCGEAHHHECIVSGEHPPQYLDLPVGTGFRRYRLVRDPVTGQPARDPGGALVFVPAREDKGPV